MTKMTAEHAKDRLQSLPGWVLAGEAISRQFTFSGFADAITFIVRLGFGAEAADHHPDLVVNYKRVTVTYSTHSEGGLTGKDFEGAQAATKIAAQMSGT
jgi:4a-hydroxytetrahydrobiopterin dehydratase